VFVACLIDRVEGSDRAADAAHPEIEEDAHRQCAIDASRRQPSDPPQALHPFSYNDLNLAVTNPLWSRANSRTVPFVDR
jgi:hypothetical protein